MSRSLPGRRPLTALAHQNLPAPLTPLIGRQQEIAAVRDRLRRKNVRMLTLTGPPGVGKTRLALEVARRLLANFPDGVVFVDLALVRDLEGVVFEIARALKIRDSLDWPLLARLKEYFRHKALLLVLDNFEQVLPAAPDVAGLLAACPRLKVLATSRAALRISAEHEFPVPPLAHPDPDRLPPPDALAAYPAVALFVDRARSARPRFALTLQNARAVAEICQRLDGLPLALELAATRIRVLPPQEILKHLQQRLGLLTSGPIDLPARQRTLSGAIGWSYDLLSPGERMLFRHLGVFASGCSIEAADAVCKVEGHPHHLLDALTSLIDKSLLRQELRPDGEPRFAMLETIREYAQERLAASGESDAVQRRHAAYFLALADRAEPELQGPDQSAWLARLEADHDNFRAALSWCLGEDGEGETGLRLAAILVPFWEIRGYWNEGRRWLEAVLRNASGASSAAKVKALNGAGMLAFQQGDFARAAALAEESLSLGRALGDRRGTVTALNILGFHACATGDYGRAEALGSESLTMCREVADPLGIADALHILGLVARDRGDPAQATASLEESLRLSRALDAKWRVAINLTDLGLVMRDRGQHAQAAALIEEGLQQFRALGHRHGTATAQSHLATVAWYRRQYDRAAALFSDSLILRRELGDVRGIAVCLVGLAAVASATRQDEKAARLFGAGEGLRESIGVSLPLFIRGDYERLVGTTRRHLADAFQALWAEGRTMTVDQASDRALATSPAVERAARPPGMPLTRREQEVAVLVAQGRTNREIAAMLVITEKTAENHVQHILNKLGFRSRAQIAAWTVEHGLGTRS
ncbi:MAG: tetratricopeptide repeat protein [Armatimonadetes bacterium]|nr:tetratricopeptide repeat protein [Armatimonadota bacterium]